MFALSDAKEYYRNHTEVYIRKQPEGPFQQTMDAQSVVEGLCQSNIGSNTNVTTDNWFNSFGLAKSLENKN